MFLNLLKIEYKNKYSRKYNLVSLIVSLVFAALFVCAEVYTFFEIDAKIENYSKVYGTFDFLVLFLFVELVLSIAIGTINSRKTLFHFRDYRLVSNLPISNSQIIISKTIFLFLTQLVFNYVICLPLLITYCVPRDFSADNYIFAVCYPAIITLLTTSVSLILSTVYQYIYRLLSHFDILHFIATLVVMLLLCFIYDYFLQLFLTALSDSSIGGVFDQDFIEFIHKLVPILFPINNLLLAGLDNVDVALNVSISCCYIILFSVISIVLTSFAYTFINRHRFEINYKFMKRKNKVRGEFATLFKKEFDLLFRNNKSFSFVSFIAIIPFLCFVVINSLNKIIVGNMAFVMVYYPQLVHAIYMCLILLFANVVNASASMSISREGDGIAIIKTMPVKAWKIVAAKLIIPFVLSTISLLVSCSILFGFKLIDIGLFLSSLAIGILINVFTNLFGLYIDMKSVNDKKKNYSLINTFVSIIYPLILIGLHAGLTFTKINEIYIYLIDILITLVMIIPFVFRIKHRYSVTFAKMEVN